MRCRFELQSRSVELRLPRRRRVFLPLSGEISARLHRGQRPFSLKGGETSWQHLKAAEITAFIVSAEGDYIRHGRNIVFRTPLLIVKGEICLVRI